MAKWTNKVFDEQATKLAQTFWAGIDQNGATLTELVTKTARDHGLNPEQIERLARVTNSKAFEAKFAAMKSASDRHVEFPVADAKAVIAAFCGEVAASGSAVKTAALYPDLASDAPVATNYFDGAGRREKTAAVATPRRPEAEYFKLRDARVELDLQLKQAENRWTTAVDTLVAQTKLVYWDHDAFEKDALAVIGIDALPELNVVRSRRKMAALDIPTEKVAEILDRLVGSETRDTTVLKTACEARATFVARQRALRVVDAKLATLKKALAHGP